MLLAMKTRNVVGVSRSVYCHSLKFVYCKSKCSPFCFILSIETLRLRFLGIFCEPRTSRSHVTRALPSGLRFEFTLVRLEHAPEVSGLPQGFLHSKTSQSHVWEEVRLLRTLLLIDYRNLFLKKLNFEDNFSANNIELSGWMKTNMAAASYYPRILSPKYRHTDNVKPLTANRSLSFAVKWPHIDVKVSNKSLIRCR